MTLDSPTRINPMISHRAAHIGRAVLRREDRSPLTGRRRYVADLRLPGMLEVAFVRSPEAHARIVSIDTGPALALPGVHAVFTGADLDDVAPFPHKILYIQPVGQTALAVDRVRYVGSPYAAVVATDRYVAEDAASLVAAHTEFESLPAVADLDQALAPDAPRLYDDWPDNYLVNYPAEKEEVTRAFEEADHTYSDTFISPRQTGLPLECRGVLADVVDGEVTLWSSTQSPHIVRTTIAEMTGIPEPRIRVITPAMGGGFGTKTHIYPEDVVMPLDLPPDRPPGALDRGPLREPGVGCPRPGSAPRRRCGLRRRRDHPRHPVQGLLRRGIRRDLHAGNRHGLRNGRLHHGRLRLPEHGGAPLLRGDQQDARRRLPRVRRSRGPAGDGRHHRPGGPPHRGRPGGDPPPHGPPGGPDALPDARGWTDRFGFPRQELRAGRRAHRPVAGADPGRSTPTTPMSV